MSTYATELADKCYLYNYSDANISSVELEYLHRIGSISCNDLPVAMALDSIGAIEQDICETQWSGDDGVRAMVVVTVARYSVHLWSSISQQFIQLGRDGLSDDVIMEKAREDWEMYLFEYTDKLGVIHQKWTYHITKASLEAAWLAFKIAAMEGMKAALNAAL